MCDEKAARWVRFECCESEKMEMRNTKIKSGKIERRDKLFISAFRGGPTKTRLI